MSYVDLDPLSAFSIVPSTWLAQLLANTEALHDGTGFASHGIPSSAINFGGSGAGIWWEEIARTTLGGAGDTITTSTFSARKYLKILISAPASGQTNLLMRFNNDSGSNYAARFSTNGAADSTVTSDSLMTLATAETSDKFSELLVINISAKEKLVVGQSVSSGTAGAANTPSKWEVTNKWANTSNQITRVDVINTGSGDFASGSEVVVLGHD